MRNLSIIASAIALTTASAFAQSALVPPAAVGPFNGTSAFYFTPGGISRFQMIYDSSTLTSQGILQPISINAVKIRYGGVAPPLPVVTYPNVSVFLQNSAVDWSLQSTTYAANRTVAFPTTPNFVGSVTSGVTTTANGDFYVNVPLAVPFSYDPTSGVDLLVEFEINGAPTPVPAAGLSTGCAATGLTDLCAVKRSTTSVTAVTGANSAFKPIIEIDYTPAPNAGVATPIGTGCIKKYTSMYELFAAPANFDLQSSALTFLSLGGLGYAVNRTGAFLPIGSVQATPTVLALGDDTEVNYPFTVGSFPGWTGIQVCSNGYVAKASGNSLTAAPSVNTAMGNPQEAFYCQLDLDPITPGLGSGTIQVEESATVTTVTWDNVTNWNNAAAPGAAPCTFQFQLYPSGDVTLAFGPNFTTFNPNGGVLVGYSPGGPSQAPPSTDISALGAGAILLEVADTFPLALASLNRPVVNTTWNLEVNTIPNPTPAQVGVEIYGFSDPGFNDLFFIGAPGCPLRANLDILNPFVHFAPATTHNYSLAVPNAPTLIGVTFFLQAAMLDPSYNAFGAITSNGISGLIGSI